MKTVTVPGIHDALTAGDYHSAGITPYPALSSAIAVAIVDKCARVAWYKHPALNPNFSAENRPIYDRGSAAHGRVLEPERFQDMIEIILAPDYKTKAAQEARDAAYALGRVPVLEHQLGEVLDMARTLESDPVAGVLLRNGFAERSHFWRDEKTGIWCKCRPDYFVPQQRVTADMLSVLGWSQPASFLINYKTHGGSVDPVSFARHVSDMDYVQRAAWEMDGVEQTTAGKVEHYLIVAQETDPPYIVATYEVMRNDLEYGAFFNRVAAGEFARCLERGTDARSWPGYRSFEVPDRDVVMPLDLPPWKRQRSEERRLNYAELGKKRRALSKVGADSAKIAPYFAP